MSMRSDDSDYDNYTETSDSEDQDSESTYGGNAQSILSNLDESIGKIDDFLTYERGFSHGDIVCSITDPSGQLGRVIDVDMVVDLETHFGDQIKDVNSKKIQKVRPISVGDCVVHGPWVGRVEKVHDAVIIVFNDGSRCEIMTDDSEILIHFSSGLFEDAPYPYYPGQRVKIKLPNNCKSVKWLSGSASTGRNEGIVCNVEVGMVRVNWIASLMMGVATVPLPPRLQDPKSLTLLSCFPYANWQLGDWCTLPSNYFGNSLMTTRNYSPPSVSPFSITMLPKLGMDDQYWKRMYIITKIKTKVDVLWQNGSCSVGLDSQTLFPVNGVGDHDFWPGQFVLEKSPTEDRDASSGPKLGIVRNVDAQDRTVKVNWKVPDGEAIEEMVSAYELIEHPDFSYSVGDLVFRDLPHDKKLKDVPLATQTSEMKQGHDLSFGEAIGGTNFLPKETKRAYNDYAEDSTNYLQCIGNIIAFKDEGIEVRWATGLKSQVYTALFWHIFQVNSAFIYLALFVVLNNLALILNICCNCWGFGVIFFLLHVILRTNLQ